MHSHSGRGRKWQRLTRKRGLYVFVAFCIIGIVALVGLLMYLLTSMNWRERY